MTRRNIYRKQGICQKGALNCFKKNKTVFTVNTSDDLITSTNCVCVELPWDPDWTPSYTLTTGDTAPSLLLLC